jgi:hypothetical protein
MNWRSRKFFHYRTPARRLPFHTRCRLQVEQLESRQLLSAVLTYHNDLSRTGQILDETALTPDTVSTSSFGKLFTYPVDGQVYAQPLYVPGVPLADGSTHNVVFVATEHDSVYAFDANSNDPNQGGGLLWQTSFLGTGISPFSTADAHGCTQISPELGITSTPVIDPIYDPNTGALIGGNLYVVAQTKETIGGTTYHQKLHVLDITTGQDIADPVEIQASVINDSGRVVTFMPQQYKERAALTLSNGVLYTAWASHCDITPSNGWVIGYDAATLKQVSVFNTSPNGSLDTIWQGDGGLAVDQDGNLYFETGNGTDITGHGDDYSEAFLRLNGGDGQTVDDYFIPFNYRALDLADRDVGSGAPIVLPDLFLGNGKPVRLLVGSGKEGKIYVLNRDNLGGLNNPPVGPDLVWQSIPNALSGGSWDTPAFWDGGDPNGPWLYYVGNGDFAKAFQLQNGFFTTTPTSQSPTRITGNYGATPIISANGNTGGILWALQNANPAILHAYDATDLSRELWNSNQVPGDRLGNGVKFNSPIVADGEVFVPGSNYLTVFGLTGSGAAAAHLKFSAKSIGQVAALVAQNHSAQSQSPPAPIIGQALGGQGTTRLLGEEAAPAAAFPEPISGPAGDVGADVAPLLRSSNNQDRDRVRSLVDTAMSLFELID